MEGEGQQLQLLLLPGLPALLQHQRQQRQQQRHQGQCQLSHLLAL